jgi:hypothetical protein
MPNPAVKTEGGKFMWDSGSLTTEAEARAKKTEYEKEGFETHLIEEDGKYLIYTRRIVTEIILEEGGHPL